ncbi:DNA-binding protein [Vogesella sp. GCM10023246]|uniref:DNA-binding protein n=1 Tax=Vogesella oryzagri TaxID=3160864 RepID=A0ABV1M2W0_9NEIS
MFFQKFEDIHSLAGSAPTTDAANLPAGEPGLIPSFADVAAAASLLAEEGLPVTTCAVRDALGDVSLSAVQQQLAAWRASQPRPAAAQPLAVPAPLAAALTGWAQQLVDDASGALRNDLTRADDELAALCLRHEQLEADHAALQRQLGKVTEDRDQAMATLLECDTQIERLTVELQHARDVASNALVGKAKDQLAIDGKDAQLAELRLQLERNVAATAAQSDARLAAEMELVGAATARDNLAAEVTALRAELDACRAERRAQ